MSDEQPIQAQDIYGLIGDAGFKTLVDGFYQRVTEDDFLRPMYPEEDLAPAAHRLQLFLIQYFGGPMIYSQQRGHPRLRMRHMPFKIDGQARDHWLAHMLASLEAANFAPAITQIMHDYFVQGANFLMNQRPSTPPNLTIQAED